MPGLWLWPYQVQSIQRFFWQIVFQIKMRANYITSPGQRWSRVRFKVTDPSSATSMLADTGQVAHSVSLPTATLPVKRLLAGLTAKLLICVWQVATVQVPCHYEDSIQGFPHQGPHILRGSFCLPNWWVQMTLAHFRIHGSLQKVIPDQLNPRPIGVPGSTHNWNQNEFVWNFDYPVGWQKWKVSAGLLLICLDLACTVAPCIE